MSSHQTFASLDPIKRLKSYLGRKDFTFIYHSIIMKLLFLRRFFSLFTPFNFWIDESVSLKCFLIDDEILKMCWSS